MATKSDATKKGLKKGVQRPGNIFSISNVINIYKSCDRDCARQYLKPNLCWTGSYYFGYHTLLLPVLRLVKPGKPGLAGHNRPKPLEALKPGSGFKFCRPKASKSQAVDPAFRPSWAGKSLILMLLIVAWLGSVQTHISKNPENF